MAIHGEQKRKYQMAESIIEQDPCGRASTLKHSVPKPTFSSGQISAILTSFEQKWLKLDTGEAVRLGC